jgi:uncharacterized membrane protein YqaE (UPF0057 family)
MRERLTKAFARPAVGGEWLLGPEPVLRAALFAILAVMLASGFSWWCLDVDLLEFLGWLPGCAFRAWTGLPCPGCGMGHALIHLSRLQWIAAIGANPAAPFLTAAIVVGAFRRAPDRAARGMNPILAAFSLVAVIAAWLWRVLPMEIVPTAGP